MIHLGTSENYQEGIWDLMDPCEDCGSSHADNPSDPALLIALAAKRCYMSFEPGLNPNVNKVRKDWTEYLDNVLKSKHGSVCEHSVFTFAIEGVSRVFTGEMNRHRAGVGISEGSMRYIRYDNIPWWLPTSLQLTEVEMAALNKLLLDHESLFDLDMSLLAEDVRLAVKKHRTLVEVFQPVFEFVENKYTLGREIWKDELAETSKFAGKKHVTSMLRRIIPMGVATGGVWTMNIRALRHILALRASEQAEEEILHVFSRIGMEMVKFEPSLFGDFEQTPEGFWVPKYAKV